LGASGDGSGADLAFILRRFMDEPGDPGKKVSPAALALLAELEAKSKKTPERTPRG
jgi:hypothetical protein